MNIEIYTLSYCPYCAAAKNFFDGKGLKYTEYRLDGDEEAEFKKLQEKFNIKGDVTAPQIVLDGKRIGGYSDLMHKIDEGELAF